MTVEDLPRLTPRQQLVVRLVEFEGLTAAQAAARLGGHWNRNAVAQAVYQARHRLKTNFVPRTKRDTCPKGHPYTTYPRGRRLCKTCKAAARSARAARLAECSTETPVQTRARVQREVAQGKRCARCWLLSPCADHEERT